jgi:CheY-like chemotaxis protein
MTQHQTPFKVLIVEDEAVLAMDLEAMIEDCGHHVIGEAMSLSDVQTLPSLTAPDVAFVDVQLADGSSGLDVCAFIRDQWPDTAVVFVTANPKKVPDDFCGAHGVIPKPFTRNGLLSAMRFIEEGLTDPPPTCGQPASFVPAPHIAALWSA